MYAIINQDENGDKYIAMKTSKLPERIRLDDGTTRTDLSGLSPQELAALGVLPLIVENESYNPETEKRTLLSETIEADCVRRIYHITPL